MARPKKEEGTKCVRQNISIEPELLSVLITHCQKEERSMSWVIKKALEDYLLCNATQQN
jgi:hypothetical protein